MLGFIPDGYTRQGYVEGRELLYDAIRFKYRPMLVQERQAFLEQTGKGKAEENNNRSAALCAQRISWWSLTYPDGEESVPIEASTFLRLQPILFERLFGIVMGVDGGDQDPLWDDSQKKELQTQQKEAKDKKVSIGQVREASDSKN